MQKVVAEPNPKEDPPVVQRLLHLGACLIEAARLLDAPCEQLLSPVELQTIDGHISPRRVIKLS